MDGLVFDHEWALIHTNEEDLLRENSCSFVMIRDDSWSFSKGNQGPSILTRMVANPLRFREWPQMWLNENVAELVRVPSRSTRNREDWHLPLLAFKVGQTFLSADG
jgi:hypothetical protein